MIPQQVMERTKRSIGKGEEQIDRLSALPDDVVCYILSFLPTKQSMATSILSSRWRFLWTHVPILDFPFTSFSLSDVSVIDTTHSDIIHRVILLHRAEKLNSFSFFSIRCTEYQLETWINIAIDRNVRNLDICPSKRVRLPRHLFTCKTLVELKLTNCNNRPLINVAAVSLPSLKKLHLCGVRFQVEEDIAHLLSGCPVLEHLVVDHVYIIKYGNLRIFSPTIVWLELNYMFEFFLLDNRNYRLNVNAPALRYLKLHDFSDDPNVSSFKHISFSPMTSLIEADINVHTCSIDEDDYYSTRSGVEFFNFLSNVKCLKLSGPYPVKVLQVASAGSNLRFDNLSKLEVKLDVDWRFVTKLLEMADNLEVLIVGADETYWMEPKQVPTCLSSRIRTIRIDRMTCTKPGFNMVRYFLRNAGALEKMEIFSRLLGTESKRNFDALQRMSLFEVGSKACQLAFY
ncbi:hypothetical protein OROMI_019933 [Orobanche minor]